MCFAMNIAKCLRTAFLYRAALVATSVLCIMLKNGQTYF